MNPREEHTVVEIESRRLLRKSWIRTSQRKLKILLIVVSRKIVYHRTLIKSMLDHLNIFRYLVT